MADRSPPPTDMSAIVDRFLMLERRIADLERPTGTQLAQTVANMPVPGAATVQTSNFGAPQYSWSTVASLTVTPPAGKGVTDVFVVARVQFKTGLNGTGLARLAVGGVTYPEAATVWEQLGNTFFAVGRPLAAGRVSSATPFSVDLQVSMDDAYSPAVSSTAMIQVIQIFSN